MKATDELTEVERKEVESILRGIYSQIKHLDTAGMEAAMTESSRQQLEQISWQLRVLNKDINAGLFWKRGSK